MTLGSGGFRTWKVEVVPPDFRRLDPGVSGFTGDMPVKLEFIATQYLNGEAVYWVYRLPGHPLTKQFALDVDLPKWTLDTLRPPRRPLHDFPQLFLQDNPLIEMPWWL